MTGSATEAAAVCARCQGNTNELIEVDTGMKLALETAGSTESLPERVCPTCYEDLSGKLSRGVKLRAEKKAREQNRIMMWKSRVNLVKQARQLMDQKAFAEAAVAYEKYIRVLEIVYSLNPGHLTPDVFNNSTRSKEMTVIASAYWDLLRIYDTSPAYGERMRKTAAKLALFAPYSSMFNSLIKKAETFQRSAKNPHLVRSFLKATRKGRGPCFIATAAFGDPTEAHVMMLRRFRDQTLRHSPIGRGFIFHYYRLSPPLAHWLEAHPRYKPFVRMALRLVARRVRRLPLKRSTGSDIV